MSCDTHMPDKDLTFQMRVSEEFLRQIDKWRGAQFPVPSRAAAIRILVLQSLRTQPGFAPIGEPDRRQKGKKR